MGTVHAKDTYVSLGGDDISAYTNSTTYNREADTHEDTSYGSDDKTYVGGLRDGTVTIGGRYDNTALTGPRAVIMPLLGTTVECVIRPEGTGASRPEDTMDVVVNAYNETFPVADIVTWTAELQITGGITYGTQSS
ncbi:hypothetical protein BLA60_25840 [Actinophytocola xinjiangensis]|uniref:Uncharacterized protein n=1 Tax=Actinophytocola xinjiangensis TaxID=485602 RepID=A0A7Z0WJ11_9PSEU|nr:hypothetical protein [Actinophytocola xinjiangensis]OLF07754.1 hypothetical protein BLA60_25840 [Actinophytocola xinjiangensis]